MKLSNQNRAFIVYEDYLDITPLIYARTCIDHFDEIQYACQKRRPLIKINGTTARFFAVYLFILLG